MTRAEMRGNGAGNTGAGVLARGREPGCGAGRLRGKEDERPVGGSRSSRVLTAADRERILKDARTVEFPVALRGYDRAAVDRYVERMSRLITELEMSSSPEAAVRHALDEVSEETRDILQRAHETADEITARSRGKADDRLEQAERESEELREAAERETADIAERPRTARSPRCARRSGGRPSSYAPPRNARPTRPLPPRAGTPTRCASRPSSARELARSAETIWRERRRLVEDMRAVGEQLVAIGETESRRFPRFGEEGSEAAELLRDPAPAAGHRLLGRERACAQARWARIVPR